MLELVRDYITGFVVVTVALVLILFLAGCSYPQPPTTACPPITEVPAQTQAQMALELRTPPPKPALAAIVSDWIQMRDRLRKCEQ